MPVHASTIATKVETTSNSGTVSTRGKGGAGTIIELSLTQRG